jgi:hypothetical protein
MADRFFNSQSDIVFGTDETALETGGGTILSIGGGSFLSVDDSGLNTALLFLVQRNLNSQSDIQTATADVSMTVDRQFSSSPDIQVVTAAVGLIRSSVFESTADIASATTDVTVNLENQFFSTADIQTVTQDVLLESFGIIRSDVDIQTSTTATALVQRYFNSQSDAVFSTSSVPAVRAWAFSSSPNVEFSLDGIYAKYSISGIKKLEYFTTPWTPDHLEYMYPKFKDFVRVFLRYLDYNSIHKTLTLTNNNDLNKIFPEFLSSYLDQYLNGVIDFTKYDLTYNNKQLFILLSRLLNNSKGTQKAFSYLFRSLTNIRIANEDINISVDKIIAEFIENESWLTGGDVWYHDGTYNYDGTIDHEADIAKPYTYQFKIDQSRETMLPLIRSVHPAGFQQEFLIDMGFEDTVGQEGEIELSTTYYHYYSYGVADKTGWLHDGTITYSESHVETTIG